MVEELSNRVDLNQTWGQVQALQLQDGRAEADLAWFHAGHLKTVFTKEQSPSNTIQEYLDSFEKEVTNANGEAPFRFVVTPVLLKVGSEVPQNDAIRLVVKIDPSNSDVTLGQLKDFTQKVRGS